MQVFERGWLSANNILFQGRQSTALVDTGYATHSPQTVSLVRLALGERGLDLVLNTHLHSDHCGGNAALQEEYAQLRTLIPPGLSQFVRDWDPVGLTYAPTGQTCPRFRFDGLLKPGEEIVLADLPWQIHSAPGHDPHSVILFEPASRTLLSADALWENGFGIVFEELEGQSAFDEVAATLDLIESLAPRVVIPGHGAVFDTVDAALSVARSKLQGFVRDPRKHARHAAKVLLKFKLLEIQQASAGDLVRWAAGTGYFPLVHQRFFTALPVTDWLAGLIEDLVRSGAARREGEMVHNS
jgi:glyoxylase-like metal-dependent hydrolase (beta-lactamase superfamily II)